MPKRRAKTRHSRRAAIPTNGELSDMPVPPELQHLMALASLLCPLCAEHATHETSGHATITESLNVFPAQPFTGGMFAVWRHTGPKPLDYVTDISLLSPPPE